MREKIVKLYKFDELSEKAKDRAVEKLGDINVDYDWWEATFDDFEAIAPILGISFRQHQVKLINGGVRYESSIFFSGFSSQGDGACFEGSYHYEKESVKKIKEYAPEEELHGIAQELQDIQKKYLYRIAASVKHTGNYSHEYATTIEVEYTGDDSREVESKDEEAMVHILRKFMKWMYRRLGEEYEYQTTREAVIESIEANEYEFTEDGTLQ